jgi:hypothetical protein
MTYNLDTSSENIIIGSRGLFIGHINFVRNSIDRGHVAIEVHLPNIPKANAPEKIAHNDKTPANQPNQPLVKACIFENGDGKPFGFGIASGNSDPVQYRSRGATPLNITVHLPAGHHHFHHFEARFGGLPLNIADPVLNDITFGHISLIGAHAPIFAEGIDANRITVANRNASIHGAFTADYGVTLQTTLAPVVANVTLANHNGYASTLRVQNNAGPIDTSVKLVPSSDRVESDGPPAYQATFITQDSDVKVNVTSHPFVSTVQVTARSKKGDVRVQIPPYYEGKFNLKSSSIVRDTTKLTSSRSRITDPAQRGRHRSIGFTSMTNGDMTGVTGWMDKNSKYLVYKGESYAVLSSTFGGKVELII